MDNRPAQLATIRGLEISRDLSGGVKLRFGREVFVLSPQQAVGMATALLKSAGVNVEFSNPGQSVISTNGRLPC